ncbi:MAG: YlbF family regulator [Gemmatimonadetes bacterium]|nr:YlbF family regulator [Gemmatimonadota bacterium]
MLEDKAKDLGRTIGQSEEYKAVKRSSEALEGDREASTVLRQMEQVRQAAQQLINRGEEPTPEMEQQLDGLLAQVQGNASYQRAIAAQENFDKLMLRVNQWIAEGIRTGAQSPIILA